MIIHDRTRLIDLLTVAINLPFPGGFILPANGYIGRGLDGSGGDGRMLAAGGRVCLLSPARPAGPPGSGPSGTRTQPGTRLLATGSGQGFLVLSILVLKAAPVVNPAGPGSTVCHLPFPGGFSFGRCI